MFYSDVLTRTCDELAGSQRKHRSARRNIGRSGWCGTAATASAVSPVGTSASSAEAQQPRSHRTTSRAAAAFAASLTRSLVFPDSAPTLAKFSTPPNPGPGLKLVVLSNIDTVYTAEEIGSYN
jgi:hypothetical protein